MVGEGLSLREGEEASFTGRWVDDARFGRQFRATTFTPLLPETMGGIRRFLVSGMVKGIGEATADKLIGAFGDRVLEVLENEPGAVARIKGIGQKRARSIAASLKKHRGYRDLLVFLQAHGIGPAMAMRIHKRYKGRALTLVREDPYRLALEVTGIGFLSADRLALSMGLDHESPARAQAGILYKLEEAFGDGHVFLPYEELLGKTARDLKIPSEIVARAMLHLDTVQRIIRDADAIYLTALYDLETFVAQRIGQMTQAPPLADLDGELLQRAARTLQLEPSEDQMAAVKMGLEHRLVVITGGPGTGKTTLIRSLVAIAAAGGLKLELASPTGRAAKRLAEATGREARTLHRLLEFDPETQIFQRNRSNPLKCDLLVIDEGSMVDLMMMGSILDALKEDARLVLVGDADQLPSVGAGTVFRDLVESGTVPVERLHHIFRQARGSLIVENAHRILKGEALKVPPRSEADAGQDFFVAWENDPDRIVAMVKMLMVERIPEKFGFDPMVDVQVLAPMHRGRAGVSALNRELQDLLNPDGLELVLGERRFRVGDRVMQTRNDYDKNIFNGDLARIRSVNPRERSLTIDLDGRLIGYQRDEIGELSLAYATSVHKSQGSEYPAAIVVLAREHYIMCQRNLLYTAVTRGKALTVLVGALSAVTRAVENDQVDRRYSKLRARIGPSAGPSGGPPPPVFER